MTTPGVIPIHIDITDPWSVEAAAAIANDVTLLIDNAGMASSATLLGGSIDDVRAPMESHFFGTLSVTRASAPHLIANPPGRYSMLSPCCPGYTRAVGSDRRRA